MQRGTLDYMAPELLDPLAQDGESMPSYPITSAVDVYSFGLVLWQIVTGEAPDRATSALRMPRCPSGYALCSTFPLDSPGLTAWP